jgi:ABC-type thiamine transport system ATPase subunit
MEADEIIAVMGVTGAGKSSLIKLVTENDHIVIVDSLESRTPTSPLLSRGPPTDAVLQRPKV